MIKRLTTLAVCISLGFSALTPPSALAGVGQYNLPSLGTVAGADLTVLDERALGEELMKRIRADASYMADPETQDYLNRLGHRLVAAGENSPYNFFFFPIRDKSLNAFALPGGFIAVHSGLIVAAQNESELAGVIGHEIGHVTQRHIARMLEQGQNSWAMTLGSILLALLAARAGGSSGGDAAVGIMMGTQAAMIQNQLGYSRDAEREADRVGLMSLQNAGFDPRGMERFFERLQQNNRWYESTNTAYLSTHPLSTERMSDMQNRTRQLPVIMHQDSVDFLLIQARMKVLQETRFDGWQSVAQAYESDLNEPMSDHKKAAAYYGLSIAYTKMNQAKKALSYARKAKQLVKTVNIVLDKNLSELTFLNAQTPQEKMHALELAKSLVKKYPYSALAVSNCAELLYQAQEHEQVIHLIRNQDALSKSDPDYFAYLARSYEALGKKSLAFACTGDMYALMGNAEAAVYQFDLAQKANDGDFYVMSEIDAKLREQRRKVLDQKK